MKRLFFLLLLLLVFLKPPSAFAEKINSFDVQIAAHKDGLIDVIETINYDFEDLDRHGIYRFIPLYSKVGDLYRVIKIENVKVSRNNNLENFTKSQDKNEISFKIGKKDKTITGSHVYKISYTVENAIGSNFPDHDEIYWNVTGNDWEIPIESAEITISTDFDAKQKGFICFTGIIGSKEKDCETAGNTVKVLKTLSPGEGLTAVAVYPPNTFPKSILSKSLPSDFAEKIFGFIFSNYKIILIVLNVIVAPLIFILYHKGKNRKKFGPPAVNFDIPQDEKGERLPPALAGTIDTAKLERDDVVATIFDLAIRKYIELKEVKTEKKLFPDSKDQIIIKLKGDDGKLSQFEKVLFERLFKDGETINLGSDLKLDFYKTFEEMEKEIFNTLVAKGYYTKNPKVQKALLFAAGITALFTLNVLLGVLLLYLSFNILGRTALGDEIDHKIDGLKLFLKSMDRNFKWQAEKFYIVERMIPYAMALGYIDKFMEQLKIIKPDYNPTWYTGYSGSFYGSYLGFYAGMNNSITTSAPSSSSGFSGGSSGGGGGSW